MSLLKNIADRLPEAKALPVVSNFSTPVPVTQFTGNDITLYPMDTGQMFIQKGYNLNDAIFSIVGKNAEKFSQPRLYHMKVSKNEQKTLREYRHLKALPVTRESVKELKRMYKSMVEDKIPDSKLAKLLDKPNRFQSQAEWLEQLFGFRELTGEANLYFNRGLTDGPPLEMLIIPKPHLLLVVDSNNPWEVQGYVIRIGAAEKKVNKGDVVMWKYPSYLSLDNAEHLRGQSPLEAARVLMQGMNEADLRTATSNKNAGAAGLLYTNSIQPKDVDETKMARLRGMVNNVINNNEMAGRIAMMAGEWGYHNFGYSVSDLKLLEQYDLGFLRLCRVFKTPSGIFDSGNSTYDNQKQFIRQWIYSLITPRLNTFVGILDSTLVPEFDLDPEQNLIDFSLDSYDELNEDLKDKISAIKDVWELTPNMKLKYWGFEPDPDPNMDKRYVPQGLTPFDELNVNIGDNMNQDVQNIGG